MIDPAGIPAVRTAALNPGRQTQVALAPRHAYSIQVFAQRHREFARSAEPVADFRHRRSGSRCQLFRDEPAHLRLHVRVQIDLVSDFAEDARRRMAAAQWPMSAANYQANLRNGTLMQVGVGQQREIAGALDRRR